MWLRLQTRRERGLAGGRSSSLGDGHSLASVWLWKEVCYSVAGTVCGPGKPETTPAQGGHCQQGQELSAPFPSSLSACFAPLSAQGRNSERWEYALQMILEPIGKQPLLHGQFTAAV